MNSRKTMFEMMYALMMAGLMADSHEFKDHALPRMTEEEEEYLRRKKAEKIIELKRRGQTEFNIDGVTVYALNRKNAERKVRNFKKQISLI